MNRDREAVDSPFRYGYALAYPEKAWTRRPSETIEVNVRIGIPREIKDHEFRVAVTPSGAKALVDAGHEVRIESGAGAAIGLADSDYEAVGARCGRARSCSPTSISLRTRG